MGLRRVRGVRSTLPNNTIIGRRSGGSGKAEMLDLADVARDLQMYGAGSTAPGVVGVTTLAGLSDVSESGLADNDLLRYQTSDSKWHNVAKNTYSALITVLGTIATGVWQGTKIALAYGGTNADLSGTGGTSQVLKQTGIGSAITVAQLAASDLSNGTTGSGAVVLASAISGFGSGTVTSVSMTVPAEFAIGGSPITGSGTLAVTWAAPITVTHGGTGADLSATGGTSNVVLQESVGAVMTVRALSSSDIAGFVPPGGNGVGDWDGPFTGGFGVDCFGAASWGGGGAAFQQFGYQNSYVKKFGAVGLYWDYMRTSDLVCAQAAASAGQLGEQKTSTILIASAVSLSSGVTADVTSLSLPTGVWWISGNIAFSAGGTTNITTIQGWITNSSASSPTRPNNGAYVNMPAAFATGTNPVIPVGGMMVVVPPGANVTYFLSSQATFATSTLAVYGFLGAVRMA